MLLIEPTWYDWLWLIPFLAVLAFLGVGMIVFAVVTLYGAGLGVLVVAVAPFHMLRSAIARLRSSN